jgi:hypothetical protein
MDDKNVEIAVRARVPTNYRTGNNNALRVKSITDPIDGFVNGNFVLIFHN